MKETDLDAKEMEELNMEKRLRLATKKMEEMVKEQLRNSGVVPSGLKNNLIKINIQVENFLLAELAGLAGENPRKSLAARAWRLTRQDHPAYNHDFVALRTKLQSRNSQKRLEGLVKKYRGVGRSRDGMGHEVLTLVQGVGRAIFSYP